jgi:hypothetical protein
MALYIEESSRAGITCLEMNPDLLCISQLTLKISLTSQKFSFFFRAMGNTNVFLGGLWEDSIIYDRENPRQLKSQTTYQL